MKTYRHRVRVHWGHIDPAKIVFYPNYFAWFDQSTLLLFESVGLGWNTLMEKYGVPGLPIVEARSRFLAPCKFFDEIMVESSVGKWHDKTLEVSHTVLNGDIRAVEGCEIRIWVKPDDSGKLKALSIPPEIRAAFE